MSRTVASALWVVAVGCAGAPAPHAGPPDARADAAPASGLRYQGVFVDGTETGHTIDFSNFAKAPGNAIVVFVASTAQTPSAFSLSSPGWSFTPLVATDSAAVFGAVAPDTGFATFTLTSSAGDTTVLVADELTGNDPTGGQTTFDASSANAGVGDCSTTITTGHDGDAIWALCHATSADVAPAPGFEPGDHAGPWRAEYKLTGDPAGTAEVVPMPLVTPGSGWFAIAAVTIKPR